MQFKLCFMSLKMYWPTVFYSFIKANVYSLLALDDKYLEITD